MLMCALAPDEANIPSEVDIQVHAGGDDLQQSLDHGEPNDHDAI